VYTRLFPSPPSGPMPRKVGTVVVRTDFARSGTGLAMLGVERSKLWRRGRRVDGHGVRLHGVKGKQGFQLFSHSHIPKEYRTHS
jgi:hypothetical protein